MTEQPASFTARMRTLVGEIAHLVTALRELHGPYGIYGECDHDLDQHAEQGIDVITTDEFETCEAARLYSICRHCCTDELGRQSEKCEVIHKHGPDRPLCPTIAILDGKKW